MPCLYTLLMASAADEEERSLGWLGVRSDSLFCSTLHSVDPNDQKKTACYDIDVEVEDPLKGQMSSFLLSTANQQEITALDNKVQELDVPWCLCL